MTPRTDGRSDFAAELDHVLRTQGTSMSWLAQYLSLLGTPVTTAALSYWRSGRSRPKGASLAAVANIEHSLGLEQGALMQHLSAPSPAQAPRSLRAREGLSEVSGTFGPREMGAFRQTHIHAASVSQALVDGGSRVEVVIAASVRSGSMDRLPIYALGDPPPSPRVIGLEPLLGADMSEPVINEDESFMAAYLLLDRPVEEGETFVYGYAVTLAGDLHLPQFLDQRVMDPADAVVLHLDLGEHHVGSVHKRFNDDRQEYAVDEPLQVVGSAVTAAFVHVPVGLTTLTAG